MKNLKVLYAEDEHTVRQNHVRYLNQKYDFNIIEAGDGLEAFELYLEHKPQVLLTDITMPKMCGLTLIEKIREIDNEIKIIVLSAHDENDKLLRAIELNLTSYQIKPINRAKLNSSILKAIDPKGSKDIKFYFNENTFYERKARQLIIDEKEIKLTKYETLLLELFIENKNKILSAELIHDKIWNELSAFNNGNIRTLLKKLRKKLPDNSIQTLYGEGYKLVI